MFESMPLPVDLLEKSFALVAPRGAELVDSFYYRLFQHGPALRALFSHADPKKQHQAMFATLSVFSTALRELDQLVPALAGMGARHATYGVRPEHYPMAGVALLGALAEVGGDAWQPEYASAWAAAFSFISEVMLGSMLPASFAEPQMDR